MIPLCNGHAVLTAIFAEKRAPETLNDDYAWHLQNAAVVTPDPWLLRLLPAFVRTPLMARVAARKYEEQMIAMWETSPHLLDDIGMILATDESVRDHLVAAPARVIDHVKSTAEGRAAAKAAADAAALAAAAATAAADAAKIQPARTPLSALVRKDIRPLGAPAGQTA